MVELSNWRYCNKYLSGICTGHERLADGLYITTSPVLKIECCADGFEAYTQSGTHYHFKIEDIALNFIEETNKSLKKSKVNTRVLNDKIKLAKKMEKEKVEKLHQLLEENELYLEFYGIHLKCGYFKQNEKLIPLESSCHVGMFQDSYLIIKSGIVDVRYFDHWNDIEFYHISDGVSYIHIKQLAHIPFSVTGIGDGLTFEHDDTSIKKIKVEKCMEGLFSPDCVNGKSAFFNLFNELEDNEQNDIIEDTKND